MGATADEEPPHDAYEQVTDPGRYQVLHEEALKQIEQLVTSSAVNRFEGVDLDSRASSA